MEKNPQIAVLIPCYNEALTIGKVIDDMKRELPEAALYVYDNNSSDGTGDIARSHGAIVRTESRQGKGNVVRQMLRDIDADYYVMIDGDDTYPADRVRDLLKPLEDGLADHVVGGPSLQRDLRGGEQARLPRLWKRPRPLAHQGPLWL